MSAPRRPLLRLATAAAAGVVGVIAWLVPWFDLVEGVALLTVVALVHAYFVARMRARTEVLAAA